MRVGDDVGTASSSDDRIWNGMLGSQSIRSGSSNLAGEGTERSSSSSTSGSSDTQQQRSQQQQQKQGLPAPSRSSKAPRGSPPTSSPSLLLLPPPPFLHPPLPWTRSLLSNAYSHMQHTAHAASARPFPPFSSSTATAAQGLSHASSPHSPLSPTPSLTRSPDTISSSPPSEPHGSSPTSPGSHPQRQLSPTDKQQAAEERQLGEPESFSPQAISNTIWAAYKLLGSPLDERWMAAFYAASAAQVRGRRLWV